jgi:hypothetical protein
MGHAVFRGKSGQTYRFKVYPLGTKLRPLSGVYLVTNRSRDKQGGYKHVALYVGATEDLSQPPFAEHPKATEFKRHGANSICLQSDNSEESRTAKQCDIAAALNPTCND